VTENAATDESEVPSLKAEIVKALTEIDPTVAQSLQHVMDEAARLAVIECARWLRERCCHEDMHWGRSEPETCCYPMCNAARDLDKETGHATV
jgi:hypothetical protein